MDFNTVKVSKQELKINFPIPKRMESITTKGKVFLLGGCSSKNGELFKNEVYELDEPNCNLVAKDPMIVAKQ